MARVLALCTLAALLLGCGADQPTHAGLHAAEEAKKPDARATPLREEIDDVAPVRDEVLRNSGR